jgi:hypothetical protein
MIDLEERLAQLSPDEKAITSRDNDHQVKDEVIKNVIVDGDRFTLEFEGGTCLGVMSTSLPPPGPGQMVLLYGKGMGYSVRGIVLPRQPGITEDRVYRYATPVEQVHKDVTRFQADRDQKRRDFDLKRAEFDAWLSSVPPEFQERIARFRKVSPDWESEFGPYEKFVCSEALKIAAVLHDPDKIKEFAESTPGQQVKIVPDIAFEEHSGNTFSAACNLAYVYTKEPSSVPKWHGALCALVGCKDYGCFAAHPEH